MSGGENLFSRELVGYLRAYVKETAGQKKIREACEEEGLPLVSTEAGPVLAVLARGAGGRRALEIGGLLGYGASWLASSGAHVDSLEIDPTRAQRARDLLSEAGLATKVEIHVGDARRTLLTLTPGYDLCFIDANKEDYLDYLEQAVRLVRPGGLIVADNVLWSGKVFDKKEQETSTVALRRFTEAAFAHPKLAAAILPIGDGFLVAAVKP